MTTEQSLDYLWVNNKWGLSLVKFKQKICMTVYEDSTYQIFHTEIGNYVFNRTEEKVYELSINSWTRMVLKLESLTKYGTGKPDKRLCF